jgi:hypothetical protein
MVLRFWKCGSANEEVQGFAIEASKILDFDHTGVPRYRT